MKYLHKLVLAAFGAAFFMAVAQAQNAGTVTNHAIPLGKGPGVTGFGSLALGNGQVAIGQTSADPQAKTLSGDVTLDNAGVTAIGANKVTNAKINPGASNTLKGSINGTTTSDLAIASCSAIYQFTQWVSGTGWQCGINPVLPSRAVAATLNLAAFTSIRVLGYTTPGDGGEATFVKTSGNFRDSYTTAASVTSNGGTCTNGTYRANYFTGGNGVNFQANILVSGGVASLLNILDYGGNAYSAGDVLTVNSVIGGCSPQVTISAVSTALASFTDAGSIKWQYVVGTGYVNPLAFGCKFNWTKAGGDAGATSDTPCVRGVLAFAAYAAPNNINFTTQAFASNRVLFPPGTALLSGTDTAPGALLGNGIIQPVGVIVEGAGPTNTIFKVPDAGIASNFWNLCDVNKQAACFGTAIRDIGLTALSSGVHGGTAYLLYSNSVQQLETMRNVQIYDGTYGCYRYDNGYGGAATTTYYNFFCTHQSNNQDAVVINSSTTIFEFQTLIIEGASNQNAFSLVNGHVHVVGFHTEGITTGFSVNGPASSSSLTIEHATGGSGCTNFAVLQGTNSPGNFALFDTYKNGCSTNLVLNGQAGGSNRTIDSIPAGGWTTFNP